MKECAQPEARTYTRGVPYIYISLSLYIYIYIYNTHILINQALNTYITREGRAGAGRARGAGGAGASAQRAAVLINISNVID